jgi:hypothetical protein
MHSEDLGSLADDVDDLLTDLQALAGPSAGLNGGQIFIDGFTAGDGTLPRSNSGENGFWLTRISRMASLHGAYENGANNRRLEFQARFAF